MSRAAVAALALAVVLGLGWLVKTAFGDERPVAYSLGVAPAGVVAKLAPGERACQEPIDLPVEASAVVFPVSTNGRPGQPLEVTVRTASGAVLGRGTVAGGYADGVPQTAQLGRVVGPVDSVAVCIRNDGDRAALLLGSENVTSSRTIVNGVWNAVDLDLRFLYDEPRAYSELLPDALDRAALFKPGWVGAWFFWVLLGLLVLALPVLLGFALWRAAAEDYSGSDSTQSSRRPQSDSASEAGTRASRDSATGSSTTAS